MVVFGADHVYRMDAAQMLDAHIDSGAGLTVAGIRVPRGGATEFGVIETGPTARRIDAFLEKPADPPGLPGSPDESFASMGNYIFTTRRADRRPAGRRRRRDVGPRHGRRHRARRW